MAEGDDTGETPDDLVGDDPRRLRQRIVTLEARNRELGERLAAIQGSTSWRMTRPVRDVMEGLKRRRRGGAARPANPSSAVPGNAAAAAVLDTGLFDADFYRSQAGLGGASDVAAGGHYARIGEAEGIRPNPGFDPRRLRRPSPRDLG